MTNHEEVECCYCEEAICKYEAVYEKNKKFEGWLCRECHEDIKHQKDEWA